VDDRIVDEVLLRAVIEDFKRYCPIPVSAEDELLLDKIARLSGLSGSSLPRELGLSFLGVEKDEKPERQGLGCHIYTRRHDNTDYQNYIQILPESKVLLPSNPQTAGNQDGVL
jgi:hypothetical protein